MEVTAPEGVPGGPGTAKLPPQPRVSPAGEGERSHPHPAQGWSVFSGSPCNYFVQARPGLRAPRGQCRALAPGPSSRSAPGAGMDTKHQEQQLEGFLLGFFWLLVSLKSFLVGL